MSVTAWVAALPVLATAVGVLLVPGLVTNLALGATGPRLWALAPPVSLGVLGGGAVATQMLGWHWGIGTALMSMVGAVLLAGAVRVIFLDRFHVDLTSPWGPSRAWWGLAWALAATLGLAHLVYVVGRPDNIAQIHDNAFHLNAVRYVLDTGRGSSLTLAPLGTASGTFYPAAWHDVVGLVCRITGADVPTAITSTNLVVVAVSWCTGCVFLATRVLARDRSSLLLGAVLSAAFSSFPYLLFNFGVVYPWMTGISLLPGMLGLGVDACDLGVARLTRQARTGSSVLLVAAVPGVGLAHPGVLVMALALAAPLVTASLRRASHQGHRGVRRSALCYAVLLVVGWILLRPPRQPNWDGYGDPLAAFLGGVLFCPVGEPVPWVLVGLLLLGLVATTQDGSPTWPFWIFVVGLSMHIATQLSDLPELKWWLTGSWYSDPFRAASMLPVASLPLILLGARYALEKLKHLYAVVRPGVARSAAPWRRSAWAVLGVTVGCVLVQTPAVLQATWFAHEANKFSDGSRLLTLDERRLLRRIPEHVPPKSMIAGDPMTGAALSYAYTGRPAALPYLSLYRGAAGRVVMDHLDEMSTNPDVCPAVRGLHVDYVLDFGSQAVDRGRTSRQPGLQDLSPSRGFRLVDWEGPARLFRVTGCSGS